MNPEDPDAPTGGAEPVEPVDAADAVPRPRRGPRPAPSAPSGRSRQQLAVLAAIALGTLVVVAVLASTLLAGDGEDAVVTTTLSPQPTVPLDDLLGDEPIPSGDYGAFCAKAAEAAQAGGDFDDDPLAAMRTTLRSYDIDELIAAAPEGLRPALTTIRDQREEVLLVLEQVDSTNELSVADLPSGFLDAFGLVTRAAGANCGG
jgi:hypothetical protein